MKVYNYTNTGLLKSSTSGSSGGAPTNAEYAVFAANGTLTNEVLLTDGSATGNIYTQGEIGHKNGNDLTVLQTAYMLHRRVSTSVYPIFYLNRAQESGGNPATVGNNDVLGLISFGGYNSPAYRPGVELKVTATSAAGSAGTPSILEILVAASASAAPTNVVRVETGKVGIGVSGAVDSGAALQVDSTTGAFYPPTMTTTQRNALSGVDSRAIIYNNSLAKFQGYQNSAWVNIVSDVGVDGRLSLSNTLPVTTSDVTGATSIYLHPYQGNQIEINGTPTTIPDAGANVAVPSTIWRAFDVYAYNNSGATAIETLNWNQTTGSITGATNATPIVITSNSHGLSNGDIVGVLGVGGNTAPNSKVWVVANVTTNTFELEESAGSGAYTSGGTWYKLSGLSRATGLTVSNGRYIKSGDATRLYIGTGMTTSTSGQCEDSETKRFLWNAYNRVLRTFGVKESGDSWTYNSDLFRYVNNNHANKGEFIIGLNESAVQAKVDMTCTTASVVTAAARTAVTLDSTSVLATGSSNGLTGVQSNLTMLSAGYVGYPGIGYHFLAWLESAGSVSMTYTFYGDAGAPSVVQSAMRGTLFA